MPTRTTGGNIVQHGDHRRRGNKHISHIRHHTHTRTGIRLTTRPALKLIQGVFPRKILVPPLTQKCFETSTETKNSHLLLTLSVLFSSFSSSLYLFSSFSSSFFSAFAVLSSLPLSSSLSQLLQKSSSRMACIPLQHHLLHWATFLFPSLFFLLPSSICLFAPLFLPSQTCLTASDTPFLV